MSLAIGVRASISIREEVPVAWFNAFLTQVDSTPFGALGFIFQIGTFYGVIKQIKLNRKTRTAGLEPLPYLCTLFASACYGINTSIEVPNMAVFWPQLISVGLAATLLGQILYYRKIAPAIAAKALLRVQENLASA